MFEEDLLQGPELPARSGVTKQLVIFFHGLGSNGDDLIALAPFLQKTLPDAKFISPNAIEPYDMAPIGYQWYSVQDRSDDKIRIGLTKANPKISEYIKYKLAENKLDYKDLIIIGFSQGTMTSLYHFLREEQPIKGLVGFSGALPLENELDKEIKSKFPVCLIHGMFDDIVQYQRSVDADKKLRFLGVKSEVHLMPNLMHSIDEPGMEIAKKFLKSLL